MISTRVANNALERYRQRRTPAVQAIQKDTADFIAEREREIVPVDTGNLQSTIEVVPVSDNQSNVEAGGEKAGYAGYVEHGTEKMAAQPYHRPAAMEGKRYQERRYSEMK
jgi:HK97 gp10 family phage protein